MPSASSEVLASSPSGNVSTRMLRVLGNTGLGGAGLGGSGLGGHGTVLGGGDGSGGGGDGAVPVSMVNESAHNVTHTYRDLCQQTCG